MTNSWPKVSLGELLRLERRPVKVEATEQYREIGIYCFGRGIFHKEPRSGLEVGDKSLFLIKEGDFILQVTFAWEGAVAVVSAAEHGMYGSTRYPTFRVDESRCVSAFLLNYFKTQEGIQQLIRICPGSAGRNRVLNLKRLPEVLVPLPSVMEQRRIVAWIDNIAEQVGEARSLRVEASEEASALCRAILAQDTETKLTPMRELLQLRSPDVTVRADENYEFAGVYSFGRGVFRSQKKSGMEFAYAKLSRLKAGDFVYPKLMAWERALGIVPPECDGYVVSPEFPVFSVREDLVLPEVLDVHFRTPSVWPGLSGASTGTNVRRRRLHPDNFLSYRMPLPSRRTQELLRKVQAEVSSMTLLQADTAALLGSLVPAVIERVFAGQI